jgi:hypothetical protein
VEIARIYLDYNKYSFTIKKTNEICELCLENKANVLFNKNNNVYYICKSCSKAKIITLFYTLINGKFTSVRISTNKHYYIIKRIKHNSFCNCQNQVEFEICKYKINHNYICGNCLKQELIKIKNYLLIIITVKE